MKHGNSGKPSQFSRLFNSWLGILLGLAFLAAGSLLIYWNEGRTLGADQALLEAKSDIVSIDEHAALDPDLNGKAVHLDGVAKAGANLFDSLFGVEAQALRLRRSVEYYQWTEYTANEASPRTGESEQKDGDTVYEREWTTYAVNSRLFRNPDFQGLNTLLAEVPAQHWLAPEIRLGPYLLPDFLTSKLDGEIVLELALDPQQLAAAAANLGLGGEYLHLVNNAIYIGLDWRNPQVGDLQVRFSILPFSEVSVIAQVDGDSLTEFISSTGYQVGELRMGRLNPEEMAEALKEDSVILNWLLRFLSYFAVFLGLIQAYKPIALLASILPVAGTIVTYRKSRAVFLLGSLWILLLAGLAWLRVRPVLGVLALLVVGLIACLILRRRKKRSEAGFQG